jgi:aspartyl-tRNA(Asn)/glutamyl-tRNA(Gln) amidotransferase subunit A
LQVIGRAFDEASVLRVGEVIERAANFTAKPQFIASPARGRA